jgi:hypothetical protein
VTHLASELLMFQLFQVDEKYFGGLKSLIRRSVVGVVTRLRSGRFGFESGEWLEIFPFSKTLRAALGPYQFLFR